MFTRLSRRGNSKRVAAGLVVAGIIALVAATIGTARAAQTATIKGKVVNGTSDEILGGAGVTLHVIAQQGEIGTRAVKADKQGKFEFTGLEVDPQTSFEVTTDYKGITYSSGPVAPAAGSVQQVTVSVFEVGSDLNAVSVPEWIIWIDRDTAGAAVQHDYRFDNSGDTTYAPEGGGPVVTVPLPEGAGNFQYMGQFLAGNPKVEGNAFSYLEPLVPGQTDGTIRFTVDELKELRLVAPFPVANLSLLVPSDVEVSAGGLNAGGTTEDAGVTYNIYTASQLQAGQTFDVSLEGLGSGSGGGGGEGLPPMGITLFGIAALLGIGALVLKLTSGRKVAAPARAQAEDTRRGRPRASAPAPGRERPRGRSNGRPRRSAQSLEEERDMLIAEIAALDLAFDKGLMPEAAYRKVRKVRRARLVSIEERSAAEVDH